MPTVTQLNNFLQYATKKSEEGEPSMTIGEIALWCKNRMTAPTQEANEPFVISHSTGTNPDGTALVRVFVSTPRLLEWATFNEVVHIDATYKLVWEGLPVIVVGTTDKDRHFHPSGLGVCSGETGQDYAFVFKALVDGIQATHGVDYQPKVLVADAADAITNGFKSVFGDNFKRVFCWFHVIRAIDNHLSKISDKEFQQRIRADIEELHYCESKRVFDAVTPLFFAKWKAMGNFEVNAFLHYFDKEWIRSHQGWYEGFAPNSPSTDNALEATNRWIKELGTGRHRRRLRHFLNFTFDLLRRWSNERDPDKAECKEFVYRPTKTFDVWRSSDQWARLNKPYLSRPHPNGWRYYFVAAGDQDPVTPAEVNAYWSAFTHLSWLSFEDYALMYNRMWVITIYQEDYSTASCNCPSYQKLFICKHSLGMAIRKGLCEAPPEAKSLLVGRVRPRGRPPKARAGHALVRD